MHDPFQTYSMLGVNPGVLAPSSFPYTTPQAPSLNPAATLYPLAAALGMSAISPGAQFAQTGQPFAGPQGLGPQQLQAAAILAAQAANPIGISPWANPLQNALQAALIANPLIAAALQNPFLSAGIQNPLLGAGQYNPFQSALLGNPAYGAGPGNPFVGAIQSHLLNPLIHNPWASGLAGYQQQSPYSPIGHIGTQFGQPGLYGQAGYPMPPQTWVGQLGVPGQRPFQSPWAQ
ncbi:MAG TPA: hypothetical protein VMB25_26305 [Bryobacteraceae bacterium]|nr:hypothetical protein [Bryobacteraceae bacterium]